MYTEKQLQSTLFFDIETSSEFKDFETLEKEKPKLAKLWIKRTEYLKDKYSENSKMSIEELYQRKAGLHAEFLKIACISFGRIIQTEEKSLIKTASFTGDNEHDIINKSLSLMTKYMNKEVDSRIGGFNIKRFDIPVLCKRAIICEHSIPFFFRFHEIKPWESRVTDLIETWSFGAWQESFASLDLVCEVLGIQSPKENTDASMVQSFVHEYNDYAKISSYCEGDVIATINAARRMSSLEILK
jgi:predicted PolB exonuclease-like 3'-5' exonuclease